MNSKKVSPFYNVIIFTNHSFYFSLRKLIFIIFFFIYLSIGNAIAILTDINEINICMVTMR